MTAKVTDFVDNTIASHKVVVFSKSTCPYCAKAKMSLKNLFPEESIHVVEIENHPDMSAIQAYLAEKTGERTVPRIFIDGNSIGGFSDLERKYLK